MKTIKIGFLIIMLLMSLGFYTEDCKKVIVRYDYRDFSQDKTIREWIIADSIENKNVINISFDSGFNDSVKIYIDGTLVKDTFLETNKKYDLTGYRLKHILKNKQSSPLLYVKLRGGTCLKHNLNLNYRKLLISNLEDEWNCYYTNNIVFRY